MAALRPDAQFATDAAPRPSSRGAGSSPRTSLAARTGSAALATLCAAAGLVIASHYPILPALAIGLFVAWTALATFRFAIALPVALALLPVVGFATLTGWLTFEETDLLVLASCAGGYAALALRRTAEPAARHAPAVSILSIALIGVFLAATALALVRGVDAAGGWHFDWFQGYEDPLNSLRIFKSFVGAVLVAPLLLALLRTPDGFDRLGAGLGVGLGLCALAVVQERVAFPGLLDFSQDYRVTAPFWEMHNGGAALDGYLALTIPFAVREAVRRVGPARLAVAWLVLALAAYACLVTFSRGVYAAVPLSLLLLFVLVQRQGPRAGRGAMWSMLIRGALFAAGVAVASFFVFRGGGYRAMLAMLLVVFAAIAVEPSLRRVGPATWAVAAIAAVCAGAAGYLVAGVVPKGPYLVFGVALCATAAAALRSARRPGRTADGLVAAAWFWLALCAVFVAGHWGGPGALRDSAIVMAALAVLVLAASRLRTPLWPEARRDQLSLMICAVLVTGSVAVFMAGAYMGGRFSASNADLESRLSHWKEGIGRLHGAGEWLLGKGLGRFPATSQFESPDAVAPGSYRIVQRAGENVLLLTAPRLRYLGFGELFRVLQRVEVRPDTSYVVTMRVRASQGSRFPVELCERQLLYVGACVGETPEVKAAVDGWQQIAFPLPTGRIGASQWFAPRPVYLAIANGNANAALEIRSVHMIGPDGVDVVANGDFTERTAHWFSSSDKWHLPWHIKNLALDVLFDQGILGLGLFALLVGAALLRTAVGRAFRHPDAPYVAAAMAAYLVVGAFDSLLDVPRVAFAFYLVVLVGLMLRNPRASAPGRSRPPPPAPPVAAPATDDAAARALRRQRAFGERRPASRSG